MKVLVVMGTRPEAIKLAPVVLEARRLGAGLDIEVCSTGQHREMLRDAMAVFGIVPDIDLDLMRPDQTLPDLTARVIAQTAGVIRDRKPDLVIVQGDTSTAFGAGLAAFLQHVPVAHVEAGLRTGDMDSPFPEEANRKLLASLARHHFAPTTKAADNLRREGVADDAIAVVGNTAVDALHLTSRSRINSAAEEILAASRGGLVLVTSHRRENLGGGLLRICAAVRHLARAHMRLTFVFPVHLNPQVRDVVHAELDGLENVRLIEPLDFQSLLALQRNAVLILTDSGGIQEEAPTFGVPVVVMREHTERAEGVAAGFATLAGTQTHAIVAAAEACLGDPGLRGDLLSRPSPYGDGGASRRIWSALLGRPWEPFRG